MSRSRSKHIVLIADPDPNHIDILKTMLAPDYDIRVAANSDEMLRMVSSPDSAEIILLSSILATAGRYKVCRKLKSDKATRGIPIILIAEPTAEDTEVKGFEHGAADYITKPFKRSVVNARIQTHLELKHCRENLDHRLKMSVSELHEEIEERRDIDDSYRALVEHARDGIAIIQDFKVKFANPAFCKMLGFSEKELIGAHLKKFISEEEFVKNTTRYSNRMAGLNLPRIYKSQVIQSDGSTIDVELNVCVVPYGRSLAALVFVRDIREEEAWKYCI